MKLWKITPKDGSIPAIKVQAASLTGAIAKAESVNRILFPAARIAGWNFQILRAVR